MNILTQIQALKKLVLENTKPPLTADLLNKLAFIEEQAEADTESASRQLETIDRLMKEDAERQQCASNIGIQVKGQFGMSD